MATRIPLVLAASGEAEELPAADVIIGASGLAATSSVKASAATSTTSTTYVLISPMTITPAAGNYLVRWQGCFRGSTGAVRGTFAVYAAGVVADSSDVAFNVSGAGSLCSFYSEAYVTVDGSQAIEGRAKTSVGTLTVENRRVQIIQVA